MGRPVGSTNGVVRADPEERYPKPLSAWEVRHERTKMSYYMLALMEQDQPAGSSS
jgi:hypothetical protein